MSIERLKELSAIRERNRDHPAIDALTEEAIDEVFDGLSKLLALIDAGEVMYEDIQGCDWISPGTKAWDKAKAALAEETRWERSNG